MGSGDNGDEDAAEGSRADMKSKEGGCVNLFREVAGGDRSWRGMVIGEVRRRLTRWWYDTREQIEGLERVGGDAQVEDGGI